MFHIRLENEGWKSEIPELLTSSDILEKIDSYEIVVEPRKSSKIEGDDKENLDQG